MGKMMKGIGQAYWNSSLNGQPKWKEQHGMVNTESTEAQA
jgi:hypothetical protein